MAKTINTYKQFNRHYHNITIIIVTINTLNIYAKCLKYSKQKFQVFGTK